MPVHEAILCVQARIRQNAGPRGSGGSLSGFRILLRSRLFIKLTVAVMLTGIVTEGMYELIMQYFQIKLGFQAKDQVCLPAHPIF